MSSSLAQDARTGADTPFADIPHGPGAASRRAPPRSGWPLATLLIGLVLAGTAVAYLSRPSRDVDPNAPRVVLEVTGMHCPLQCGPRVESNLESLPWVIPGSVTANIRTGEVTFAVTSEEAVSPEEVRRVIKRAGFRVKSIRTPEVASDQQ
ncbi:MAG: hypothetical protein JWO38_682 [Gemmataceae bacterium]|nr:hypothetical protein [Gemmataceae bacterium]